MRNRYGQRPIHPRLEYCLVDLMSKAADDPEVMDSLVTIIKFVKTRPRPQVMDHPDEMVREGIPPP